METIRYTKDSKNDPSRKRVLRPSPVDRKLITEEDLVKLADRSGVGNITTMRLEAFARRMGYQLKH